MKTQLSNFFHFNVHDYTNDMSTYVESGNSATLYNINKILYILLEYNSKSPFGTHVSKTLFPGLQLIFDQEDSKSYSNFHMERVPATSVFKAEKMCAELANRYNLLSFEDLLFDNVKRYYINLKNVKSFSFFKTYNDDNMIAFNFSNDSRLNVKLDNSDKEIETMLNNCSLIRDGSFEDITNLNDVYGK